MYWFNISDLRNLDQFQSLIKINLAHCGLNGSLTLPLLPNLTEIYLQYNHIGNIVPGDLLKYVNLEILYLHAIELKTFHVPTDFPVNLDKLWLSSNDFEIIPANAFASLASPSQLSVLYLNRNNIRYIDEGAFSGLTLKELYIGYNKLTAVPNLTPCRNSLTYLGIRDNPLHVINKTRLTGFNWLNTLQATKTQLSGTLDLPPLPALQTLLLNENALSDISSALFRGFHALESVDLSNNKFEDLPAFATPPADFGVATPRDTTFIFTHNKLTTVKEDWFMYVSELSKFDVTHNDIICDVGLCWMSNCGRRRTFPYKLLMPQCRGAPWEEVPWEEVDIQQLCPRKNAWDRMIYSCK